MRDMMPHKKIFIVIATVQTLLIFSHELSNFPLLDATVQNDTSLIEKLLQTGHNINQRNSHGVTSVFAAVYYNKEASLHCLLSHDADYEIPNEIGQTPLYIAASQKRIALLSALLKAGANFFCTYENEALLNVVKADPSYHDILQEIVQVGHWQYSINYFTKKQVVPSLRIMCISNVCTNGINTLLELIKKYECNGINDDLIHYTTYYLPLCKKNKIYRKLSNSLSYHKRLRLLHEITQKHTDFYVDSWKQELDDKTPVSINSEIINTHVQSYFRSIIFPKPTIK